VLLWRRWLRGPALVSGPVACPNCGATNPPGSRFCVRCGHRLTEK
jgi:predicted amidophosphoribosyltransferase